ncbi:hypothetical protein DJ564_30345 [Pseudomonas sp. 31-12]|uniref:hypothetical protein n=1 Tax=Pseudomonas sp. 31-12 TaxID=2201356 RepID=UPI000D6D5460|nr:hypothetical protein [Pseudomonas sp. 31-12]AWM94778.1 hypothetical protein DJ564_30345 [Pseudomonas sp. 31-12]
MSDQPVNLITPAPILTPDEIAYIKKYVWRASGLSANLEQMNDFWGDERTPINYEETTTLYSDGIVRFINKVVKHAKEWPIIETDLKGYCSTASQNYQIFETQVLSIVDTIENLSGYIDYSRTLQQQIDASLENPSSSYCPLCNEDLARLSDIKLNIDSTKPHLEELEKGSKDIGASIMSFKTSLMNIVQTGNDSYVNLDTATEMAEKLNFIPMEQYQRVFFNTYMSIILGLVLKVIKEASGQPVENIEAAVTAQLHPNHVKEYDDTLNDLPVDSRAPVIALITQTKKGQVLFRQLESMHDWLKLFDKPLTDANKGVGQVRTLWTNTAVELDRINARVTQVTQYSDLQSVVKSLKSALKTWQETDKNLRTLNELLERVYQ